MERSKAYVAVAIALLLAATTGAAEAASDEGGSGADPLPNVFGEGILFAPSGFDAPAKWSRPFVGVTVEGPGLHFHFQKDAKLIVRMTQREREALKWRVVVNDVLAAEYDGDPLGLVIAFSRPNLVVGRVPTGTRVAQEDGGYDVALLREARGDRTQFAFAYEPTGGRAAADAASIGLSASLKTVVENRIAEIRRFPVPRRTTPRVARVLLKAFTVMQANTYAPEEPLRTRWTTPDRWPHRDMGLWDSAFHSLGLMHLDAAVAKEALLAVYQFQTPEGMIPHRMSPEGTGDHTQPPLLGWAAAQVFPHGRQRDREFLARSFEAADKHVTWILENRRLGSSWLFAWKSAEESGADNAPRFDDGTDFAAVDFSCYLAKECRMLQRMAQQLGYREIAQKWSRTAEAIETATRDHLWDEDRGFFFDRRGPDGEWVGVWSHTGFLPLWAGIATKTQAAQLVRHLRNEEKFWTRMPVPSVARDDPAFEKDMWRGPTWVNTNYLIIKGLRRYGYKKDAEDLRARTLFGVIEWYERTGALWEFYDPDGRTPPARLDRKDRLETGQGLPVISDYHPTAATFADLVMRWER
jgi:hypothetical protein